MRTAGYTIVTPNYLAHGLSVRESFLRHNPGCDFYIGVAGRKEDNPIHHAGGFYYVTDIEDGRIPAMLKQYNALEFSCALKPFFASLLFERQKDLEHLIYLDGDILVFHKFDIPAKADITLSPHRISHIGFLPQEHPLSVTSLNRFGVFNAGYFEVTGSKEGIKFLDWWKQLMSEWCYDKPDEHFYVDQLWLNCIPVFFEDVRINRHPGYNLAYWNLIERELTVRNDEWLVNGEPLVFFHYSHYKPENPERMTSFDDPFLSFAKFPLLKPVYDAYRESLLRHGYGQYKSLPYPFSENRAEQKKGLFKKLFGGK